MLVLVQGDVMTRDELKKLITSAENKGDMENIANKIMSISIPWFFQDKFADRAVQKYDEFKYYMAQKFEIPATDIFICGSALLGYSLDPTPMKTYKDFNEKSDIDIVIINNKMYDAFWEQYFDDFIFRNLKGKSYIWISKMIFKRFIDFHTEYAIKTKTYKEWEKKTSGYQKDLQIKFDFPEKVSYRIYRSYNDYKTNLLKNLYDIKNPYNREEE